MRLKLSLKKPRQLITARKIKLGIRSFLVRFMLPIPSILLVIFIRNNILTYSASNPFTLFTVVILFHSIIGGIVSGIYLSLVTGLMGYISYVNSGVPTEDAASRTIIYIIQTIIVAFIVGKFTNTVRRLREINKKLSYSEEKLRRVIDSVFATIVIAKLDGEIEEINKAFLSIIPVDEETVLEQNIIETYPWSYDPKVQDRLKRSIQDVRLDAPIKYDEILRIGENKYLDVELSIAGIDLDFDGTMDLIMVSGIDISSRKAFEQELIKGREIYSRLINSNILGMAIGDVEGNLKEANKAFLSLVGIKEENFIPGELSLKKLLPEKYKNAEPSATQMLKEKGFYKPLETELIRPDGQKIPIMISGVLVNEEHDDYLRLVVNLSSQKELERKKDEFISIASHELKTPLTTLKGFTQVLQQRLTKRHEDNMRFTTRIDTQINKLTELINELLDMSKIQAGKLSIKKESVDIVEIIKDCISGMEPYVTDQKINFDKNMEPLFINADKFRIEQVLVNFLTNAIKHSKSDGSVNVFVEKSSDQIKVTVEDFGQGIPESMLDKIFEKFYQVKSNDSEEIEGLGLGLYISSEIIQSHGGEIGVESTVNVGSRFYFYLPIS